MKAESPDRDRHGLVAMMLFAVTVLLQWRGYIQTHEAVYLLGPHRVADPSFLARDLSWSVLPPTSFLYDHLLAPLWSSLGDFGIVTAGRLLFWALTAWSLAQLTRALRLPAWSVVLGYSFWILAGQRMMFCGSPLEGFQPKALSYPLIYFALTEAIRGRLVRAGALSGLAAAFHIVVGGWGLAAILAALVLSRRHPVPKLLGFLVAAAPFVAPLVIAVRAFQGGVGGAVLAEMDRIYVTFAEPHCCDPSAFLSGPRLLFAGGLFLVAPTLVFLWPRSRDSRIAGHFVLATIALFGAGLLAYALRQYGFLKLYPFQLANALPGMLVAMFVPAWLPELRRASGIVRLAWAGALALAVVTCYQKDVMGELLQIPGEMTWRDTAPERAVHYGNRRVPLPLYEWIRRETPRDAVFVTPFLSEFWVCAERAQVASMRHPPADRRLVEWRDRLLALNRNEPFAAAGLEVTPQLSRNEGKLSVPELIQLRERYGATHYITTVRRSDLEGLRLTTWRQYHVYALAGLASPQRSGR